MPAVFPYSPRRPLNVPLWGEKAKIPSNVLLAKAKLILKSVGTRIFLPNFWFGRMSGFHEIELKFGVVNNAVYAKLLPTRIGVNCEEVSRSGEALAVSELTIKFISPLRSGCKFVAILEAKGTAVWLDNKYRPTRIPSHIRCNFTHFQR
ncbi:hypothetical protein HID58_085983 [Brassica napus]|uniref:Thioesterase domain-containing protein n=1 Tax=Brassica napus TaxID=3708 RepID=A0ABQ7XP59_BRANA|nr:hypothetical protein HID58_085983 [Brassica napus]